MPAREAITAEEMAELERRAAEIGITRLQLMENAGRAVAEVVLRMRPKFVAVLAGTGNNGGDGFVAARHLLAAGVRVRAYLLGRLKDMRTEESRANAETLRRAGRGLLLELPGPAEVLGARRELRKADVIVDAVLGTGIKGELREPAATAVRLMNELEAPVVAVDVPTGVNPTTGEVAGEAVRAEVTVSLHAVKWGLLRAKRYAGRIIVASLGLPPQSSSPKS
jgi:NAD(P)H-hydrate epimerase